MATMRHHARKGEKPNTPQAAGQSDKGLSLTDILGRLRSRTDGKGLSIGEAMGALGTRAFGPVIAALGLVAASPLGAVPGLPMLLAALLILLCAQILIGKRRFWLPASLERRWVDADSARRAFDRLTGVARVVDRLIKPRWCGLFTTLAERLIALLAIALAASMVPLELVPFGVALPALALTLLGLSLTNYDGFLLMIGIAVVGASGAALFWLL